MSSTECSHAPPPLQVLFGGAAPVPGSDSSALSPLSVERFLACAKEKGLTAGLMAMEQGGGAGHENNNSHDECDVSIKVLAVSEGLMSMLDVHDYEHAIEDIQNRWCSSMLLRAQATAYWKLSVHGCTIPTTVRRIYYHKDRPAEARHMWCIPCLAQADGQTYKHSFVYLACHKEEGKGSYSSLIHEHLGHAFTPAIVSVLDTQGNFVYQNAASMAAFGIQGCKHRAAGSPCDFNLLDELFIAEPETVQEMRAAMATALSNGMFTKVVKVRSKELQKWLGNSEEMWFQVQVSHTLCPDTMQPLFVLAQVDITSEVHALNRVAVLQAENKDLHTTAMWLEEQKHKVHETNLRLKESLVEALAARDMSLECEETVIDIESPADKAIQLLGKFLEGQEVSVREVLAVRDVLLAAGPDDFFQPVNFREQMDAQMTSNMDEDVGRSLMDMLIPSRARSISRPSQQSVFADSGFESLCPDMLQQQRQLHSVSTLPNPIHLPVLDEDDSPESSNPAFARASSTGTFLPNAAFPQGVLGDLPEESSNCGSGNWLQDRLKNSEDTVTDPSSRGSETGQGDAAAVVVSGARSIQSSKETILSREKRGSSTGSPRMQATTFNQQQQQQQQVTQPQTKQQQQTAAAPMHRAPLCMGSHLASSSSECSRENVSASHTPVEGPPHSHTHAAGQPQIDTRTTSTAFAAAAAQAVTQQACENGNAASANAGSKGSENNATNNTGRQGNNSNSTSTSVPMPIEAASNALHLGGLPFVHALHALWEAGFLEPSLLQASSTISASGTPTTLTAHSTPSHVMQHSSHNNNSSNNNSNVMQHSSLLPHSSNNNSSVLRHSNSRRRRGEAAGGKLVASFPIGLSEGGSQLGGEVWEGEESSGPGMSEEGVLLAESTDVLQTSTSNPMQFSPGKAGEQHVTRAQLQPLSGSPRQSGGVRQLYSTRSLGREASHLHNHHLHQQFSHRLGYRMRSSSGGDSGNDLDREEDAQGGGVHWAPNFRTHPQPHALAHVTTTAGSDACLTVATKPSRQKRTSSSQQVLLPQPQAQQGQQSQQHSVQTGAQQQQSQQQPQQLQVEFKQRSGGGVSPSGQVAAMMHLWRNPPDLLAPVLQAANNWWWDAFELNDITNGRPLSTLAFALLTRHYADELKGCCVDETRLARFLMKIEDSYLDNPYHNRVHGTDVLQWTHMLMKRGGVLRALQVCDASTLATVLSAVVHDVGHKGLNNDFLIRSGDQLALVYNDISPMENHHLAATFTLLAQDRYNFLERAPKEVRDTICKQIITMVLATDMKQHFSHTSLFKSKVCPSNHDNELNTSPTTSMINMSNIPLPVLNPDQPPEPPAAVTAALLANDDELKSLALAVALKCADLGNLAAPNEVHKRWVAQLEEEYFQQGDREKVNGLSVSPLMDRSKAGVSKSQPGFFNIVGRPLFKTFTQVFPSARPILDGANSNYAYWKQVEEEGWTQNQQAAVTITPPASH